MLAILTKMTLTQVSTWFANARRRLKKDNKMTWGSDKEDEEGEGEMEDERRRDEEEEEDAGEKDKDKEHYEEEVEEADCELSDNEGIDVPSGECTSFRKLPF